MKSKWKQSFILTEQEWKERLLRIEDKGLRTKIAYIIWWDFFSEKAGGENMLKEYISKRIVGEYSNEEVFAELSKIYPVKEAASRLGVEL